MDLVAEMRRMVVDKAVICTEGFKVDPNIVASVSSYYLKSTSESLMKPTYLKIIFILFLSCSVT